jgi:hypothetical protein
LVATPRENTISAMSGLRKIKPRQHACAILNATASGRFTLSLVRGIGYGRALS